MVKIFALSEGESARGEGNIYSVSSLDERVEEAMHAFCIALAGDNDDEEGEVVG